METANSSNKIRYSIIIPHYNIPDLLGRCLRSIPDRDDIQVIVVDDNSPDNATYVDKIHELSRKNVEFYVTKDALGAGHARNIGLGYAKGEWVIFCDSDDFFDAHFSTILDEYGSNSNDIIFFNIRCCDCYNTSKIYENVNVLKKFQETGDDIYLRVCYTEPWGKLIKKKLIVDNKIEFQETKAHNDLLFSVKTGLMAKSVIAVDKVLYYYVIREGSIGHQKGMESFEKLCDRVLAWYETQRFLDANGVSTSFYLPVRSCITALSQSVFTYLRIIWFAHKNNMKTIRILIDTLRAIYYHAKSKEYLAFHNMISRG